jgi:hypothetical protein
MSDEKVRAKAVELFELVKDIRELLDTLWHPIPYEVKPLIRRADKLIAEIEESVDQLEQKRAD